MKGAIEVLWVGLGGFLGSAARFLLARLTAHVLGTAFPYGTLLINVSGSFVLGLLMALIARGLLPNAEQVRLFLCIGFLGAYTTFSTYEFESHRLLEDGRWGLALLNLFGSLAVGFVAVRLGLVLGARE